MSEATLETATLLFEQNRKRLVAIAYGMLGAVADADDVVQDSYLRWVGTDLDTVRSPEGFLTTLTTRLAIDRLRSAQRRREVYPGPWLPEPVPSGPSSDPADIVAAAESMSLSFLSALEHLNPVERAVLLLRDVFDMDYPAVADVVDRSPANCRQIAVRARTKAGRGWASSGSSGDSDYGIVARYVEAVQSGDVDAVASLFAEDVVLWSDGGGKARAARHPIFGAWRVARHLVGVSPKESAHEVVEMRMNGDPGFVAITGDKAQAALVFEMADGLVVAVRAILNPEKLQHLPGAGETRR
jgi:RNA polymerase sigma-70 factor (ECF subfamily)